MSAKNYSSFEESRPGAEAGDKVVADERGSPAAGPPQSREANELNDTVSGSDLREMILSLGGIRAAQEILKRHRGQQANSPPQADRTALPEVVRLLGRQHAAEHGRGKEVSQ